MAKQVWLSYSLKRVWISSGSMPVFSRAFLSSLTVSVPLLSLSYSLNIWLICAGREGNCAVTARRGNVMLLPGEAR